MVKPRGIPVDGVDIIRKADEGLSHSGRSRAKADFQKLRACRAGPGGGTVSREKYSLKNHKPAVYYFFQHFNSSILYFMKKPSPCPFEKGVGDFIVSFILLWQICLWPFHPPDW